MLPDHSAGENERAAHEAPDYLSAMERQLGLWGEDGQIRLGQSTVAVGGLGGIGAVAALMLAKAGIGRIRVCDRDDYEVANIVEQAFATLDSVGRSKVEIALEELARHGRHGLLEGFKGDLSRKDDCQRLTQGADLLISAVDNAAARIALGKCAERLNIPFVVCANIGWTVVHTTYLPGEFAYGAVWRDVPGVRCCAGYPDMDDADTARAVDREWDLWVCAVSGFKPDFLRAFLERANRHYWYASPAAFFAASAGVTDALKMLSGTGQYVVYPEVFLYDLENNRPWLWGELRRRRDQLREVWDRGPAAVMDAVQSWSAQEG